MTRTTQEVFEDHLRNRSAGQIEQDIAQNYDENVVILTATGTYQGHAGAYDIASYLKRVLPHVTYEFITQRIQGEIAYLEWNAQSARGKAIQDGVETFVIRNGRIVAQTIHFTLDQITPLS